MAYFLQQGLISEVRAIISKQENNDNTLIPLNPEEIDDKNNPVVSLISKKLKGLDKSELRVEDDYLILCNCMITYGIYWPQDMCNEAENILKKELKEFFGRDSEVKFEFLYSKEEEPDPIPPMYWGELETVHYYNLSVKMKIE